MIKLYEELAMNAWPSHQTKLFDGWVIRFADGYTKRANSINPIYSSNMDIMDKINNCELLFQQKNLPIVYKLTPEVFPENLDELLNLKGYRVADPTILKTLDLDIIPEPVLSTVTVSYGFDPCWIEDYCRFNNVENRNIPSLIKILKNITTQKYYVSLLIDNVVVACGLGVQENSHIGLFDIVVDPQHRRKGYGEQLILNILELGKANGARTAYLQVMERNLPAVNLYAKIGFKEYYKYWYRVKE